MATNSPGSISRTYEAPTMSSAAVSLATTQPRSRRPSTSGRMPCGSRAAYNVDSSEKISEKAPRSCSQHIDGGLLQSGVGVGAEQSSDQGRVGGVAVTKFADLGADLLADQLEQLRCVGEVAVVGQGNGAHRGGTEGRLGVLPAAAAGGRVTGMSDGDIPWTAS